MTFKELLKEKDIHGAQLARKVGVERCTVSRWARGEMRPKIEEILKISQALGMSEKEIMESIVETINQKRTK